MKIVVRVAVGIVWTMLGVDALPTVALLPSDRIRMLLLSAAITASLAIWVQCARQPIEEVFDAGRDYERKVMLREMNRPRPRRVTGDQPSIWAAGGASRMAANPSRARSETSLSIRP